MTLQKTGKMMRRNSPFIWFGLLFLGTALNLPLAPERAWAQEEGASEEKPVQKEKKKGRLKKAFNSVKKLFKRSPSSKGSLVRGASSSFNTEARVRTGDEITVLAARQRQLTSLRQLTSSKDMKSFREDTPPPVPSRESSYPISPEEDRPLPPLPTEEKEQVKKRAFPNKPLPALPGEENEQVKKSTPPNKPLPALPVRAQKAIVDPNDSSTQRVSAPPPPPPAPEVRNIPLAPPPPPAQGQRPIGDPNDSSNQRVSVPPPPPPAPEVRNAPPPPPPAPKVDRVEDSGQSDLMKKMNRRREAIQGKKDKPLSNDFQVVATPETRAPVHVADAAQRESHKASAATYLGDIQKGGFNLRPTTQQTYKPKVEESNLAKNTEKAKARMETSNKDKVKQGGGRQPSDIKMRAPRT